MKKITFYIISILLLAGCSKVLDYPNLSRYEPDLVWNDPNLANAYLGNIYDRAFGNWNIGLDAQSEQLTGISFSVPITTTNPGALSIDWGTNYTQIRLINQGIISTNIGTLNQDVKNRLLGQLYFLRAYAYFGLVKTYGGVPYIKIPQDRYTDSLNVPVIQLGNVLILWLLTWIQPSACCHAALQLHLQTGAELMGTLLRPLKQKFYYIRLLPSSIRLIPGIMIFGRKRTRKIKKLTTA
ncbi:RagB/SusD family nutrient uptake outer membrane protein [Niabella defluvii]|nr:RagB/SusD family nutrient uptake outer membrane protein [Niabella sp. I65]